MVRMFAAVVPGLADLVARELDDLDGVRSIDSGHDGRCDVVRFVVDHRARLSVGSLRSVEDLFVEVGEARRSAGDGAVAIADRVWQPDMVQKALSLWANAVRPLAGRMTFRVVVRVLQEQAFLRTDLRRVLARTIAADRPKWTFADPAQIEVWVSEYRPGRFVAGLRLSDASLRQHGGRIIERPGALRPTVAAAMVAMAGKPSRALLDPCCGSGTILSEATMAGWPEVRGGDIDPEAVQIATANAPAARVQRWDARETGLPDAAVDAVVTNLPFGRQFEVPGSMAVWLTRVLAEFGRIVRPGGRVVVLAPHIPATVVPTVLRRQARHPLRLLGTSTALWVFDRSRSCRTGVSV
jgi:23S rRNA G2445 N2-methylase RlmL